VEINTDRFAHKQRDLLRLHDRFESYQSFVP
jgi:hypothetical protein